MKNAKPKLQQRTTDSLESRDEMNLCEFPFALLSERSVKSNVLRFEVATTDRTLGDSKKIVTVKGDPEHGLPTRKDEEIYLGLLKYTHDFNRFKNPIVQFSRSELFDLMGWPKTDWSYARLLKGLHRLQGVRLNFNLWRDNARKQYRERGAFSILDSFVIRDSRLRRSSVFGEEGGILSEFRWGSVLFESFDAGYLKKLDYGVTRELSTAARRLYRYLDKHFFPPRRMKLELNLKVLAYEHIGISRTTDTSKIKTRYIDPAIDELVQVGFLQPISKDDRYRCIRRGNWHVTFVRVPLKKTVPAIAQSSLVKTLQRRGVSPSTSQNLVNRFEIPTILNAVKEFDRQAKSTTHSIREPDRWFAAAMRDGYKPRSEAAKPTRPEYRLFKGH